MKTDLGDLSAFTAVTRAGGFREGARATGLSASGLSEAVRRLETRLGVRLLNRTTRTVAPTEAGRRLRDRPAGTLKLNVPLAASRMVLPALVPDFLAAYPDITLEIVAEEGFVDIVAAGCDAGIRYDERLEQDMIAVPIGPRTGRFATAAAPAYLERRGRPTHPRDLLNHDCLRGRVPSGALPPWEFEKDGEVILVEPNGPLIINIGAAVDLAVDAAIAGTGVIFLFEEWLAPHLASGALEPVLQDWWQPFPGQFLYYPGRRLVPPPLRAFIDFVKAANLTAAKQ